MIFNKPACANNSKSMKYCSYITANPNLNCRELGATLDKPWTNLGGTLERPWTNLREIIHKK